MTKKIKSQMLKKQPLKSLEGVIKTSASLLALVCVLNASTLAMNAYEDRKLSNQRLFLHPQDLEEDLTQNHWEGGFFSTCYNYVSDLFTTKKRKNEFDDNKIIKKPKIDKILQAPQVIYISDSEDENEEVIEIIIEKNTALLGKNNENSILLQPLSRYTHNPHERSPFEIEDTRNYIISFLDPKSFCQWRRVCRSWYFKGQDYINQLPRKRQLINVLKGKNFEDSLLYLTNYVKDPITACNDLHEASQLYFAHAIKNKKRLFQRKKIQKTKESPINFEMSPRFLRYVRRETNTLKIEQKLEKRLNAYSPYGFALLFASRLRRLLPGSQHQSRDIRQKGNIEKLFDNPVEKLTVCHPLLNNLERLIDSDESYFQSYKILESMNKFSRLSSSFTYHNKLQEEIENYADLYIKNAKATQNATSYARAGELFELQISGALVPSPVDFENCAEAYYKAANYLEDKSTKSFFYGKAAEFYEKKLQLEVQGSSKDYMHCADAYHNVACYAQDSATKSENFRKAAEMRKEQLKRLRSDTTADIYRGV